MESSEENEIFSSIYSSHTSLKNRVRSIGNGVTNPGDTRWLTHYISIQSFLDLTSEQRDMIRTDLYEHRYRGDYLYRESLGVVESHEDILEKYIEFLAPVDYAVKKFQVANTQIKNFRFSRIISLL